ncbi:DoxX family protein [Halobium salinum]|uniref:DoxX family protein n=1 Tax=Halobium salinum TaxID=1364940 RepID=A0ABD5PBW6_9EURY|nr:DoxX family protein [Halobium salinum]
MSEDTVEIETAEDDAAASSETAGSTRDTPSRLGRLLFGGVLGYMAVENFRGMEGQIGYAESKGLKEADKLVPLSTGMLLVGSIGVTLWRLPRITTGAVVAFLAGVTPVMHDFWAMDDDQQAQVEKYQFFKNVAMLGAALAFLERAWKN